MTFSNDTVQCEFVIYVNRQDTKQHVHLRSASWFVAEAFPKAFGERGACQFIFREQGNIGKYLKCTRERN